MKKEVMEIYTGIKELGNKHLDLDWQTFMNLYYELIYDIHNLYYDNIISKKMKMFLRRKLWAIKHSYKYNVEGMNEYRKRAYLY